MPGAAHWVVKLALLCAAPAAALAQGSMAQCRAELPAAATAQLSLCETHAGCRAVSRVIDSCPALRTFLDLLGQQGQRVDDSTLRRTLVEAGVPANGLASCTSDFNRALCRNFLNLEDASGETASGPSRLAQFRAALRRLAEQQELARVPADAHRLAEVRLEACATARVGTEREAACREAIEAVQACELFRQEWAQRREVLLVDAQRLNLGAEQQTLRRLEMAPCQQNLPGTTLTPQQALVVGAERGEAPAGPAAGERPAAAPAPAPIPAPTGLPGPAPTAPRADGGGGAAAGAANAASTANAECKPALRRMEERFEQIQRRRPPQADPLAVQQVEIFMLTEQMGLLERSCRGQREYDFLKPTQDRLARALQACRGSAANPVTDCVPRVAW
jgi:hypothetical protein